MSNDSINSIIPFRSQHQPRIVYLYSNESWFDFQFRGPIPAAKDGQVEWINGVLYAPLQYISDVVPDGVAAKAGIKKGDYILEVNGVSVEGSSHDEVLNLLLSIENCLILTLISETSEELDKLDPAEEDHYDVLDVDYSKKHPFPITIPDYTIINRTGESYATFNIHINGRQICTRRYREFSTLNEILHEEFKDFHFPKLPGKWPFQLSEQMLDIRRRNLEHYLKNVCYASVIFESRTVQRFLLNVEKNEST